MLCAGAPRPRASRHVLLPLTRTPHPAMARATTGPIPGTRQEEPRRPQPPRPRVRPKLDGRLWALLSLPPTRLRELKEREDRALREAAARLQALVEDERSENRSKELQQAAAALFAPITHGIHFPDLKDVPQGGPREPYASVFVLSGASADDLKGLGMRVRSQAGDVFSGDVPLSRLPALEASAAVRFVELSRPLFPVLDDARPYAQIDTLHGGMPPVRGAGVIVGVVDSLLDVYHPDFRTAAGATRVLFLWDQALAPLAGESGPPTGAALPGFAPAGGTYGVEYSQAQIDAELNHPAATPAYQTVRHGGGASAHGTHVAGCAAGNGLGDAAGLFTGGAPDAGIIFVRNLGVPGIAPAGDSTFAADAFAYLFARADLLGQPCVVNMSQSDNQGPHDGSTLGEQFLDNLLAVPGRAITLSAGNSTGTASHATGTVPPAGTAALTLNYSTIGASSPMNADDVEIWYDGHDRFTVTVTAPTTPPTAIGPVAPGGSTTVMLADGVQVQVTSDLNDPRNGDNVIRILVIPPAGTPVTLGGWTIALDGTVVINGRFHAWVDRNNRFFSAFQAPFLDETSLTLGVPATARRAITVGNHNTAAPPPGISGSSGRGPSRDGRIKPDIAAVGTSVTAPRSRNMNAADPGALYVSMGGTSMSAPLVGGACALLFECRGPATTWANLKQILADTAGTTGLPVPGNAFGFGFLQMASACAAPPMDVDVWLRDHTSDTGIEPFTGGIAWLSPDIEVLDTAGNPVANPTHDPAARFSNQVRVTVRNRGTQTARNTEVYLYWADPGTNIPYPSAWNATGIYTGAPGFAEEGNKIVVPELAGGASTTVLFAWAPPAPGSNLHGDDHFCLLVRLDNEADPASVGAGGWAAITAENNVALRNVHVQEAPGGDADTSFYVMGTATDDALVVTRDLDAGELVLTLPARVVPVRDRRLIEAEAEEAGAGPGRRPGCVAGFLAALGRVLGMGGPPAPRPGGTGDLRLTLTGESVWRRTGIQGADRVEYGDGVARVHAAGAERVRLPRIELAEGARVPVRLAVRGARAAGERRYVHVAQYAGGELVGGITLEIRS